MWSMMGCTVLSSMAGSSVVRLSCVRFNERLVYDGVLAVYLERFSKEECLAFFRTMLFYEGGISSVCGLLQVVYALVLMVGCMVSSFVCLLSHDCKDRVHEIPKGLVYPQRSPEVASRTGTACQVSNSRLRA